MNERIIIEQPGSNINTISEFKIPTIDRSKKKTNNSEENLKINSDVLNETQELISEIEKDGRI